MELAALTGKEKVIDAYCGIGTIGMTCASRAGEVIGIELNPEAVKDARNNAILNDMTNIRFIQADAGAYLYEMSERNETADVLLMDPPRSGSTPQFLRAAVKMKPERIVYVSCEPSTLARDLQILTGNSYRMEEAWPVDQFVFTEHVETAVLLSRVK